MRVDKQKVWFRCNGKHKTMFILNTSRELSYVPFIGDLIEVGSGDFQHATFRVKPFSRAFGNYNKNIHNAITLKFKVVNRTYDLRENTWELLCEPLPDSLCYLLKEIKCK